MKRRNSNWLLRYRLGYSPGRRRQLPTYETEQCFWQRYRGGLHYWTSWVETSGQYAYDNPGNITDGGQRAMSDSGWVYDQCCNYT